MSLFASYNCISEFGYIVSNNAKFAPATLAQIDSVDIYRRPFETGVWALIDTVTDVTTDENDYFTYEDTSTVVDNSYGYRIDIQPDGTPGWTMITETGSSGLNAQIVTYTSGEPVGPFLITSDGFYRVFYKYQGKVRAFYIKYPDNYDDQVSYPVMFVQTGSTTVGLLSESLYGDAMLSYAATLTDRFVIMSEVNGDSDRTDAWPDGAYGPLGKWAVDDDSETFDTWPDGWTERVVTNNIWPYRAFPMKDETTQYIKDVETLNDQDLYKGNLATYGEIWTLEASRYMQSITSFISGLIADGDMNVCHTSNGSEAPLPETVNIDSDNICFFGFSRGCTTAFMAMLTDRDLFTSAIIDGGNPYGDAYINHYFVDEGAAWTIPYDGDESPTQDKTYRADAAAKTSTDELAERLKHIPILLTCGSADGMRFSLEYIRDQIVAAGGDAWLVCSKGLGHKDHPVKRAINPDTGVNHSGTGADILATFNITTDESQEYTYDDTPEGPHDENAVGVAYSDETEQETTDRQALGYYTGLEWLDSRVKEAAASDPYPRTENPIGGPPAYLLMTGPEATYRDSPLNPTEVDGETIYDFFMTPNGSAIDLSDLTTVMDKGTTYTWDGETFTWDVEGTPIVLSIGDQIDVSELYGEGVRVQRLWNGAFLRTPQRYLIA